MSSIYTPPGGYATARHRGAYNRNAAYPRRGSPIQFTLTVVLVASLLLLALAGISRYAVGEPVIPDAVARMLHHPNPALPPGMTWDFELLDPQTKQPLQELPEVGTVEMRLAVTNDSALPMTMRFKTAKQCEFVVRRVFTYVDGLFALPLEVWRSSYFHNYPKGSTTLELQPGQTKVYEAMFSLNALNARELPSGDYRIVAIFDGWQTSMPMLKPQ